MKEVPGLYISIPFCKFKCTYCNFASGVFPRAQLDRYLSAVESEIRLTPAGMADSVYLGGGTPSLLSADQVTRLFGTVRKRFNIAADSEITIEVAPGTFDAPLVDAWTALGVNRVSLGVQSLVERELRATGRTHRADTVARDLALLRQSGISDAGIDLIAGLPHQTPASWEESLDGLAALQPTHVSVYILEADEDSRLGAEILAGGGRYSASDVPDDDTIAALYTRACQRLPELGFQQYEISNFAQPGHESRHNRKYWDCQPYLGFGVDAHSYDGQVRWGNVDDLDDYIGRMERGESPVASRESVDDRQRAEERWFLGLRQNAGVAVAADRDRFGGEIARLAAEGLLEFYEDRVRLTARGRLLSNEVFQAFI
jgi:oxygen-independent coproporphyrinogen III oxidase